MADKLDTFIARYEANFGSLPLPGGERGKAIASVWRKWLIPITPEVMDKTFAVLESHRAHTGRSYKPQLEEFKRAHAAAEGRGDTAGSEQAEAASAMSTPIFDFEQEGFPRVREPVLIELPRKTIKRFSACWEQLMDYKITSGEFRAIQDRESWFLPEWSDYTWDEQVTACQRWGVEMPEEEELPF